MPDSLPIADSRLSILDCLRLSSPDRLDDLLCFGEPELILFREDEVAVDAHVEDAAASFDEDRLN